MDLQQALSTGKKRAHRIQRLIRREFLRRAWRDHRGNILTFRQAFHRARRKILSEAKKLREIWNDLSLHAREQIGAPSPRLRRPAVVTKPAHSLPGQNAAAIPSRRVGGGESVVSRWGRVLVVGGMDFLGAALVRRLNQVGVRDIVLVDHLEDSRWKNLPPLGFTEFISPEDLETRAGRRSLNGADISHIFYLGGEFERKSSPASAKALVEFIADHQGRFISFSSAEALGPEPELEDIQRSRLGNFRPVTKDGVMASLFDRFAIARLQPHRYLALKYYHLFGPHEPADGFLGGLVTSTRKQILAAGEVRLPKSLGPDTESGRRQHDFLSVRRAAQMAVFLAECDTTSGLYELGSGAGHTIEDVIKPIFKVLKCPTKMIWEEGPEASEPTQPATANLTRMRESGWKQNLPTLKESLENLIRDGESEAYWEQNLDDAQDSSSGKDPEFKPPAHHVAMTRKPFVPSRKLGSKKLVIE